MPRRLLPTALVLAFAALPGFAQKKYGPPRPPGTASAPHITTPLEFFGFNVGDDYQEVNYTKAEAYWKKLATESNRMKMVDIGQTEEGRTEWMMIITSPANLVNLDHYRDINARLARAEGLTDDQSHALAAQGKAVVWVDGGLHASESVGFQQLVEMIYQMVSRTDPETMRFLSDDIGLYVPVNPDGSELVANWYMRIPTPNQRTNAPGLPTLYNRYIGHDDNRDSYMSNMNETVNMNKVLYQEWFPEILYNHHQTGPAGGVIFMPPFRDPFNYNFDPIIPLDIEAVGTAMHQRLVEQGMGGSEQRSGANYSTWWDGGVRTTAYFHNIVGLLTEIIGDPTPITIPLVAAKQLPTGDWPLPIPPGEWHYRQSINYEIQNNRAVLDYASRNRETLLYNIYQMGRNSIQRGNQDSWTVNPDRIAALEAAGAPPSNGRGGRAAATDAAAFGGFGRGRGLNPELYSTVLHNPAERDPRGYVIPADQPDFATATKFINALIKNGTEIERATADFQVAGKSYPSGSYVVMAAQADRPFVLDMFEPQHYPNDFAYPGGPPVPPYDTAGWTLADQMGVQFDRELDAFTGPFEMLPFGQLQPMPSYGLYGSSNSAGFLLDHHVNNAFIVINRLLKAGADVYWLESPQSAEGRQFGPGAIYVPATAAAAPILNDGARTLGVAGWGVPSAPSGPALKLKPIRIGLYDQYGGSMPSGWVRWMFDQYEFPYQVVYPKVLDAGNLRASFDVLVFVDNGLPGAGGRGGRGGGFGGRGAASPELLATVPAEFQARMGSITQAQTVPALAAFAQAGGTVLTIGAATSLAAALGLPIADYLTEMGPNNREMPLPNTKFYIPGSLMRITVDNTQPLAYGMPETADVDFDHSPVFRIVPNLDAHAASVAWFNGPTTLVSGWAWGQAYLNGGSAIVSGKIGQGTVYAIGPEITFRAQPQGTFKFLFNGVYAGSATETAIH
ncbi:MAG: M14 family metallopeptidase [Terriglobales bacterium]